jgi:acetylornithine aminotransferase
LFSDFFILILSSTPHPLNTQEMAFRASLRLAAAARPAAARFYSQAASVPTSSASSVTAAQIQRDAALPNPDPAEDSASAALIREHAHYMVATYARPPPVFVKGEGSYLWDIENRKYLDFTAGIAVNSLGHCDPEMSKLIAQQVSLPPPLPFPTPILD